MEGENAPGQLVYKYTFQGHLLKPNSTAAKVCTTAARGATIAVKVGVSAAKVGFSATKGGVGGVNRTVVSCSLTPLAPIRRRRPGAPPEATTHVVAELWTVRAVQRAHAMSGVPNMRGRANSRR